MVEENDDSTSGDEEVSFNNGEDFEEDGEDELEVDETTTGFGQKSSQKAAPTKVDLELLIEESWSPEASQKCRRPNSSDVKAAEPAAKKMMTAFPTMM